SEEHTSELQSLTNLVCRLLLEKKKPLGRIPLPGRFQGTYHNTSRDPDIQSKGLLHKAVIPDDKNRSRLAAPGYAVSLTPSSHTCHSPLSNAHVRCSTSLVNALPVSASLRMSASLP